MRRGPGVFFLLLLLFGSAYGALRALDQGWQRIVHFSPPHFEAAGPATGPPALSQRLMLIVLEGLRPEDAPLLPSLEWLQRHGASYRLTVPLPVYPVPAMATLLTGAPPELHGMLLPGQAHAGFRADSLVAAAQRANVGAATLSSPDLAMLLRPWAEEWTATGEGEPPLAQIRPLLTTSKPGLLVIHLDQLHGASHMLGGADRAHPDYRARLGELDTILVHVLEQTDLKRSTIMVVGTVPTSLSGSHPAGGQVPFIMAGAGVRAGVQGEASLTDVAPTAAALLGTPTPMQARGAPLLEALAAEGRRLDVITERWLAARQAYANAVLPAVGSLQAAPEPPASSTEAEAYDASLEQLLHDARFAWWKADLLQRLPYLGGGVLLLLIYLLLTLRLPYRGPLLATVLLYLALFNLLFHLTGGRYSGAMTGLERFGEPLVVKLVGISAAAMGLAATLAGHLCSRLGYKKGTYLAAASAHMTLGSMAILALPVLVALAFTGWEFPYQLPHSGLLIWFCITALQVAVLGFGSPLWILLTLISARTSRRLWPLKEVGDPELNADKVVRLRTLRRSARRHTVKG